MPTSFGKYCDKCPYRKPHHLCQEDHRLPLSMEYHQGAAALLIFTGTRMS